MAKVDLRELVNQPGVFICFFWCPGCDEPHGPSVGKPPETWDFNGDVEKPTLAPSILVNKHDPKSRCHSFVREGQIQFLSDCFHKLAGQTVDLPDWPEGWR